MSPATKLVMFVSMSSLALGFGAGLAVGQAKAPTESKGLSAEALRSLDVWLAVDIPAQL